MDRARTLLDTLTDTESGESSSILLENGDTVTLTRCGDEDTTLSDYGGSGTLSTVTYSAGRPADFTSAAEMIHLSTFDVTWWQPPTDVHPNTPEYTALREYVRGWCDEEWYYCTVAISVKGDRRSLDRHASLSGIESNSGDDYFMDIITALLAECNVTTPTPTEAN